MEHVGIDLGSSRSAICVVSTEGVVLRERTIPTSEIERILSKQPTSRVALESCAESRLVANRVRAQGHDVRVVPSVFVRSLGIGTRRIKTDKRSGLGSSNAGEAARSPSAPLPAGWPSSCGPCCGTGPGTSLR